MRAAIYKKPKCFEMKNVNKPELKNEEVLIKIKFSGICGTDYLTWLGKHPRVKTSTILGHEISGIIDDIKSANTSYLKIGDPVTIRPNYYCNKCINCQRGLFYLCQNFGLYGIDKNGGFAEFMKVPVKNVIKLSTEIDFDEIAVIEPLAVAVHAVRRSKFKVGDRVGILGGGPIGLLISSVLKTAGASEIYVSEINPFRINKAKEMNFEVINPEKSDLSEKINKYTANNKLDILFDTVGLSNSAQLLVKLVKTHGEVVIVAMYKEMVLFNFLEFLFQEQNITSTILYSKEDFNKAVNLIENKKINIRPIITHHLPLNDIQMGMEMIHNKDDALKILISPEK